MILRHWLILNFCIAAAGVPASYRFASAEDLMLDHIRESRSIAAGMIAKCENQMLDSRAVESPNICHNPGHMISGHVRVQMGDRVPSGAHEVWTGAQLLPIRSSARGAGSEIPGHLHLGMNESPEPASPVR